MIDNELISLLLARAQIFHNFTIEDISILLETATEEKYKAGEIIFKEGSKGRDLFIIKSGQVQITNKTEQGLEQIVTTLHDGQVFGEMSLIDKGPRSATVKALISTIIYRVRQEDLFNLREGNSQITLMLLMSIAQIISFRLRRTNNRLLEYLQDIKDTEAIKEEFTILHYGDDIELTD